MLADNAPWHAGWPVRDVLAGYPHLTLRRLPSYSPQLNPVERFGKKPRRRATHNRRFDTLADRKASLRASLSYFQTVRDRVKTLLLAVEILSASSRRPDRFTKRRIYQESGVACYWVVDLDEKAIEAWTPDATFPAVEREQVVWRPAGATDALVIPIAEILPPA